MPITFPMYHKNSLADPDGFDQHCKVAALIINKLGINNPHTMHHVENAVREAARKATEGRGHPKFTARFVSKAAHDREMRGELEDLVPEYVVPLSHICQLLRECTESAKQDGMKDVVEEDIARILLEWTCLALITTDESRRLEETSVPTRIESDKFAWYSTADPPIELVERILHQSNPSDSAVFRRIIEKICDLILGCECLKGDLILGEKIRISGEGYNEDEDEIWKERLGDYTPMSSPGLIRLYWKPLHSLFCVTWKSLLDQELVNNEAVAKRNICRMVVSKTYFHEQLHFMGDLVRSFKWQSPSIQKNRAVEEALATAWGWYCSQEYGRELGLSAIIIEKVARHCFDDIELPGYCDWKNWAHGCFFESKFCEYLGLAAMPSQQQNPWQRLSEVLDLAKNNASCCNYQILDERDGSLLRKWVGNEDAFPEFIQIGLLHSSGTYYPRECCDLRGRASTAEIIDLDNDLFKGQDNVKDVFLCNNGKSLTIKYSDLTTKRDLKWERICLQDSGPFDAMKSLTILLYEVFCLIDQKTTIENLGDSIKNNRLCSFHGSGVKIDLPRLMQFAANKPNFYYIDTNEQVTSKFREMQRAKSRLFPGQDMPTSKKMSDMRNYLEENNFAANITGFMSFRVEWT